MSGITFLILCFTLLFLAPLAAESVTSWRAIRTARKRYPELWRHSGRPTLVGNGNLTKAWPLVRYYRDRAFLRDAKDIITGDILPPIDDHDALDFAETLRGPLVWTYWGAWIGIAVFLVVFIGGGIYFY